MITGFAMLLAAGVCQGSFGLGYKKYAPFSWAAFWGIYNVLCIVTSVGFAWAAAPKLWQLCLVNGFGYWIVPLLCGSLWGLSAIGFSKGIDKIGMSMVYGISMGVSTIVGSLMPMVINRSFPAGASSAVFAAGLVLTVLGVIIVTIAGVRRDGGLKSSASGILLAVVSGLGSGAMNVGFAHSESITGQFALLGYSQAAASSARWMPVLVGGCLSGLIWCICELCAKREWKTLTAKGSKARTVKLFGTSIVWYSALLLYGLSVSMLGDIGKSAGWILFNALALIISAVWGLKTGEWNNSPKGLLYAGCAVLTAAWIFISMI